MNRIYRLVVLALAGVVLLGRGTSAQVGPDGNLTLMVSPYVFGPEARSGENGLVFRNRYEADWITATADVLVMDRVGMRSVTLLEDYFSGAEVLNTKDLDFGWEFGPKVDLIVHEILPFGIDVEAGYFSIDGYRASRTVFPESSPVIFASPGVPLSAFPGEGIRMDYLSRILSSELNGRLALGDRLSLLAGFRWIDLHENLLGTHIAAGGMETQVLDINIDNHLYGGQIGLDVSLFNRNGPFRIDGTLKAGIFGNLADQSVIVEESSFGEGKRDHTAFIGELNLVAVYEITPNILLRGGYQAMWLEGVALAGDQPATLDLFSGTFRPDVGGSLFYHGAFAGLEVDF
jgi:hypothetical protein